MAESVALLVELYGKLADPCGPAVTIAIPAAGCTAADLRALLAASDAGLAALLATTRLRLCINDQVAAETARIMPGDTVALMPPVSGG